jgi:hypothetical protein
MESHGLDLSRLRGQGYDGAANMSGVYSGVQARLREIQPLATYVHCMAHNLNLALNDSCNGVPDVANFYDMLEKLYNFFRSVRRWGMLQQAAQSNRKIALKRVQTTRWSSRNDALHSLRFSFSTVMIVLTKLMLCPTPTDKDEKTVAGGLKAYLENFSTVMIIVFQYKVHNIIHPVSQLLQKENQDLSTSSVMLQRAVSMMKTLRCSFEEVHEEAVNVAGVWCVNTTFSHKRISRVPRMFDEQAVDQRLQDPVKRFQVNVFIASIDIIVTQLDGRFTSVDAVATTFQCLSPQFLSADTSTDEVVFQSATSLAAAYSCDISENFTPQLLSFRALFMEDIRHIQTVAELADFLIVKNYSLLPTFHDLYTAFLLFLTLPVTVASAERSFSKLKLIKTYLRNTMQHDRLSGLAILSIENAVARKLDVSKIIDDFASRKARQRRF